MEFTVQRRLAGKAMRCSPKRVWFDQAKLEQIKEAITSQDIRAMVRSGAIQEKPVAGISKGRIRKASSQRKKGRRRGHGSRKGKKHARLSGKEVWINRIRLQRHYIRTLKITGQLSTGTYHQLYNKCKGGFFRSKRHIKLYLDENNLLQAANVQPTPAQQR